MNNSYTNKNRRFKKLYLSFSAMLFCSAAFAQQPGKTNGEVISADNRDPLIGVTVIVKGTARGTTTNAAGKYSIDAHTGDTLIFSYLSFMEKQVAVGRGSTINVALQPSAKGLNEVVVLGYGTQKKENVIAAVSSVGAKELSQSPAANVSNMLTGRISGITSVQDQGAPGNDQSRIYIRGLATTGDIDPLYVIDGIPRSAADFNLLAPADIESVSVLKDAAAAAVYGARGANGVILVTTKRGTIGKTTFSYSFNYGLQQATRLPDYVNSYEYAKLYNAALENEGRPILYSPEDIQKYKDGSDPIFHPNTNWLNILKGTAPMQQHNLTVSGGTEKAQYFLSFNYLSQKSLLSNLNPELGYKRYNFRSNIDVNATKSTRVSVDISGYLSTTTEPGAGYDFVFENINRDAPVYAGKYPNGLYGPGYSTRNGWAAVTESGYRRYGNNALLTRLEINQEIPFIKGLSVKGVFAFDYSPTTQKIWSLPMKIYNAVKDGDSIRYDQVGGAGNPTLYNGYNLEKNLVLEAHAIYQRSFGKNDISGLVLYSQQKLDYSNLSASRTGFLSNTLDIIDAGGTGNQQTGGSANQYHRQSIVGRVNYAYDQRYLLEFDFRYDGSDLFAQGKRFGFFPAVSAGWIISKEAFMKDIRFTDNLKLRGSYGELGNDRIAQYQYLQFYGYGSGLPFGDAANIQNTVFLTRLANKEVTWEKSKKGDLGLDAGFLKNFTLSADYFWEKRSDILGQRDATIPATVGVSGGILPYENFEKVNNQGFEVVLGYQKHFLNGLGIQTRLSITHAHNTVIDIGEPANIPKNIRQAGKPLYAVFGYKALGIFQSEKEIQAAYGNHYPDLKPGDIHYADLNGDGYIDGNDMTYIGNTNLPENIYGLLTELSYKGIDISMFWQGGTGNQQLFYNWMAKPFNQAGNALVAHEDYWRPDNKNAKYPRLTTSSAWNYDNTSSFWMYDMKYLRLKNVEIAYSLPEKWVKSISAENLRIYFNTVNLLTFSPYREVDPENTTGNGNYYPQQIVYNFGVQLTF